MLIAQCRDGMWRATGSLRELLEGNERNKVFVLGNVSFCLAVKEDDGPQERGIRVRVR